MKKSQYYKTGEIIAVGEEVLAGDTVNTNAAYLSQELAKYGIFVRYSSVVGDDESDICNALELAIRRSEVILFSGGLGPTKDDLTKETVAKFFHSELVEDEISLTNIRNIFTKRGIPYTDNNQKQALIPKNGEALFNSNGTAPGIYIHAKEFELSPQIFLLPGPPRELSSMFTEEVAPRLHQFQKHQIVSRTIRLVGIGESMVASKLDDILGYRDDRIVATYAKTGEVHVKVTIIHQELDRCHQEVDSIVTRIESILGDYIYSHEDEGLADTIIKRLTKLKRTLVTAESCTGGMLSSELIQVPGASKVFLEGYITYSNESKNKNLGVAWELLTTYGAVSAEVAHAMVEGLKKLSPQVDYAISITGIAGPEGGTPEKPVGLVFIGLLTPECIEVYRNQFHGDRMKIRESSVKFALTQLYKKLI